MQGRVSNRAFFTEFWDVIYGLADAAGKVSYRLYSSARTATFRILCRMMKGKVFPLLTGSGLAAEIKCLLLIINDANSQETAAWYSALSFLVFSNAAILNRRGMTFARFPDLSSKDLAEIHHCFRVDLSGCQFFVVGCSFGYPQKSVDNWSGQVLCVQSMRVKISKPSFLRIPHWRACRNSSPN